MFQTQRISLKLSQSELARRSGVPRIRIHLAERGDRKLTAVEEAKVRAALQSEIDRLRNLPVSVDLLGGG
jgi:transcriptional regulator with XRE-family HTH domain